MTKLADQYFTLSRWVQFVLWFALIFAIKFDTVLEPPVWDTAMGVFPPAIFLYETNFNVLELVKQADWWEGGANVHSFSVWTWFIALVMSVTHHPTISFVILHITTFAINAVAISVFVRILFEYKAASYLALISGIFLMLIPMVLVQIGYIYTESLVMSLSILAWASWHHDREARAVIFAMIAIGVKLTGVVIAFCLLPLLVVRLLNRFSYKRMMLLISIPLTLLFFLSIDRWLGELPATHGMDWGTKEVIFKSLRARLFRTPEITCFICFGAFTGSYYFYRLWRKNPIFNPARMLEHQGTVTGSKTIALIFTPLFSLGMLAMCYTGKLFLSRYMIPMIPFAIVQIVLLAQFIKLERVLGCIFVLGCLVSIYNHNGMLYRSTSSFSIVSYASSSAFSIVENSHAYQPYLQAQKTIAGEVEKLGDGVPIYVSREMDYMTSHPMMGYIEKTKPNINGVYKPRYNKKLLEDFPDQFYAVVSISWHGGERLKSLIDQAKRSEGWQVDDVYEQKMGGYEMFIKRVSRVAESKSTL
jgi:hypothetical protein